VGGLGTVGIYSFYATKVLTTGEGGMVVADDPRLLDRVRDARDYDGRPTFAPRFNYKMTEFQAALGLSQLERLPGFLARRRALAARYGERLAAAGVARPAVPPECGHIFYRYVVRVDDAARLAGGLARRGIEAKQPVFSPLHRYMGEDGFPGTDEAMRTALSLPIYPSLADADVETVVDALAYECAAAGRRREKEAPLRVTSFLPA
jgi:perosamine synthetase